MASQRPAGDPGLIRKLLSRANPRPVYKQLGDWLRAQVLSGRWRQNHKLSSETELADLFGVSRGTVRKAVEELIDEGLLTRIHGKGTFVSDKMLEQPLAQELISFSEDLLLQGIPFTTQVLESGFTAAEGDVAESLSIGYGAPVFFLNRVRIVWESPLVLLQNFVNPALCPGIEKVDFQANRLFEIIEGKFGLRIGWGHRSFEAQIASGDVGRLLNVEEGHPVMYMDQVAYLIDSSPIEVSRIWIRGDHYRITTSVHRSITGFAADTFTEEHSGQED